MTGDPAILARPDRQFRSAASYAAEKVTRDAIEPFLRSRGFLSIHDARVKTGSAQSQVISATRSTGEQIKARVRLCWRRDEDRPKERTYAAAQLRADLIDNDWHRTMHHIVAKDKARSITHVLVMQRDRDEFVYAALIPLGELSAIWQRQCEVSRELIAAGLMGRMRKNHGQNGSSPTIWLQDDRMPAAHAVADVLWNWPGVEDLARSVAGSGEQSVADDTYDDCPVPDYVSIGSDNSLRREVTRSEVRRDPKVRRAVAERAAGKCERPGCGATRSFQGFLDVHHILGVGTSDRPENCVALCPNCHREAHFAANADEINRSLLEFVQAREGQQRIAACKPGGEQPFFPAAR